MPAGFRLLFLFSAFGAIANAIVHGLTFADIVFHPILFLLPPLFIVWPMLIWQYRRIPRRNLVSEIFGRIPQWMKFLAGGLILYAWVNFFVVSAPLEGGEPVSLPDGRLVLQVKSEVRRELAAAEFRHAQALQIRLLTGHLMVFYALASLGAYACWLKSGPAMANARIR